MNEQPVVLLLEHTTGAMHVLKSLSKIEANICFVGKNKDIGSYCDEWLDYDLVNDVDKFIDNEIHILKTRNILGVLAFMENSKNAEARILKELGLLKNDITSWEVFRKKDIFRETLDKAGLNFVKSEFFSTGSKNVVPKLKYPFIVKPSMGYASGGVHFVNNLEEFQKAFKAIERLNRFIFKNEGGSSVGVICEEFIDGEEFAIDSITAEGVTKVFGVCRRGFPGKDDFSDYKYVSSPEDFEQYRTELEILLSKVFSEIGFYNGPTHSEVRFCRKDKKFKLIEIGQRVGFVGNIGRLIEYVTGVEYNYFASLSSLGLLSSDDLKALDVKQHSYALSLTPSTSPGGKVSSIKGVDFLESDISIKSFYLNKKAGDFVIAYPKGLEYLGEILLVVKGKDEFDIKQRELLEKFYIEYEA